MAVYALLSLGANQHFTLKNMFNSRIRLIKIQIIRVCFIVLLEGVGTTFMDVMYKLLSIRQLFDRK